MSNQSGNISKAKIRKSLNLLIQVVIIIITYAFIYQQVFRRRDLPSSFSGFLETAEFPDFWPGIGGIFVLMLINWGIEAGKWKFIIDRLEKVSFFKSYKAVLTGISVSTFLPNRIGDFFGRVFILKNANPVQGILVTIAGDISQFIVTAIMGLFGSLYMVPNLVDMSVGSRSYILYGMITAVPVVAFLLLIVYFNISLFSDLFSGIFKGRFSKYSDHFHVYRNYTKTDLLKILLLSLLRYLVFSTQFYLLLRMFGVDIAVIVAFPIIFTIYLVITILPSIAITALGIRGSVSIFLLALYFKSTGGNPELYNLGVLAASTFLWLINIIIPAIVGTFFVFQLKFFRK